MSLLFKIATINNISKVGLKRFPKNLYKIGALDNEIKKPVALLLRSHKLKNEQVEESISAIARCGAGTNNIPIDKMSNRGIPVFNTPGANANSVKELVLCSLFLSARNITGAINHIQDLTESKGFKYAGERVEKDKKLFAGTEIKGKTLGVIGLGAIGSQVAMAGASLGMKVIGYDPQLTIDAAWNLNGGKVKRVNDIENCISNADYISLHVPFIKDSTENLIDTDMINLMKPNASLLNFSRSELVDHSSLIEAMNCGKFNGKYCTDFPNEIIQGHKQCITIPHLGASTKEAEDNSASMAADTIMNFLESGTIKNSVNFPTTLPKKRKSNTTRFCIVNKNQSGVLMNINNLLFEYGLNVDQQINTSREKLAYNVIDVDSILDSKEFKYLYNQFEKLDGVLSVRIISGENYNQQSFYTKNT
jgi:D-3-phosphoglycerate dehydrogenase